MLLSYSDYIKLVIEAYKKKKENNELSNLLAQPTPASIRRACYHTYKERYEKNGQQVLRKDEQVLKDFFGPADPGKEFLKLINGLEADRFRPIDNYLKGNTITTDAANLELLAWLLDLRLRPFASISGKEVILTDEEKYLIGLRKNAIGLTQLTSNSIPKLIDNGQDTAESENETAISVNPTINIIDQSKQIGANIIKKGRDEENTNNIPATNLKTHKKNVRLKIAVTIGLVISSLFGGIYFINQQTANGNTRCMYWTGDHYEEAPCNEKRTGLIPLNEEMVNNFKKKLKEDTAIRSSIVLSNAKDRCQAITKKGLQCKRKAKSNGYCWQHGG
jgi:hypothetical protein